MPLILPPKKSYTKHNTATIADENQFDMTKVGIRFMDEVIFKFYSGYINRVHQLPSLFFDVSDISCVLSEVIGTSK